MHAANPATVELFDEQYDAIRALYVEAKDNVKFLSTLERHFKNLETSTDLADCEDKLPSMLHALRMVWVISRHYNTDARMVSLMQRVSYQLAHLVRTQIDPLTILTMAPADVAQRCTAAARLLLAWERTYLQVRAKIEEGGRDERWEFDRTILFADTKYMAGICDDLKHMSEVLEQFHKIFGDELKSVTGNPAVIDDAIARVNALIAPLSVMVVDPFDRMQAPAWTAVKDTFNQAVVRIENDAKFFIDESFHSLRSSEGAFETLLKFQNIRSRDAINRQLTRKFDDVLGKFMEEVREVETIFKRDKADPPRSKNQPKVAGAIIWANSLFHQIKQTVLRFQAMPELLQSAAGKEASAKYVLVAREMRQYQIDLHKAWCARAEANLPALLKKNILRYKNATDAAHGSVIPHARVEFVINYDAELRDFVAEAKYLDSLMMEVPEMAVNVALQAERNAEYVDGMQKMLDRFHTLMRRMDPICEEFLCEHIADLGNSLVAGLERLNWSSLGIHGYIERCDAVISQLEGIMFHVEKNHADINDILLAIASANIFNPNPKGTPTGANDEPVGVKEFCTLAEAEMHGIVMDLAGAYTQIGPLLTKVAVLVVGSNNLRSPLTERYYLHWERRVYNALKEMLLTNIQRALTGLAHGGTLFTIDVRLSPPDIVLLPSASEIYSLVSQYFRSIQDGSKHFARWMHGTCELTSPQKVANEDEPVTFTFYDALIHDEDIVALVEEVGTTVRSVFDNITNTLQRWRGYRALWRMNQESLLNKFASKKPSSIAFDDKMQYYHRLAIDIGATKPYKAVGFANLYMAPLVEAIRQSAWSWVAQLGASMLKLAGTEAQHLAATMTAWTECLDETPSDLDTLKNILRGIQEVRRFVPTINPTPGLYERYYASLFCICTGWNCIICYLLNFIV